MPRKPSRPRRRTGASGRPPGGRRARATPGRAGGKRKATPARARTRGKHAPAGARGKVAAKPRRRVQRPARGAQGPEPARVAAILRILDAAYPDAGIALDFGSPFQLLVATILSAQCTDVRVNQVTPALFERYPDPAAFAAADRGELEERIRSTGFYRMKARAIQECAADVVSLHGGSVPQSLDALTALRGVGRKTANVVLGNAFGIPGIVVDTHVSRLTHRLGLTREKDPVKIEFAMMPLVPRDRWTIFSHWLILHGRRVCIARKPRCSVCPLAPHCPRVGVTRSE